MADFTRNEGKQVDTVATEGDLLDFDLQTTSTDPFTPYLDLLTLSKPSTDVIFPEELKNHIFMYVDHHWRSPQPQLFACCIFHALLTFIHLYSDYLHEIESSLEANYSLGHRLDASLEQLKRIELEYTEVSKKTAELYRLCEGLLSEERHLKLFGDELRTSLAHFEALESLKIQFFNPALSAEDAHFINMLKRIDEGIDYFQRHPTIRDSENYRLKFKQLQNRALTLIRNYVVAFLKQVTMSQVVPSPMTTHAANAQVKEIEKEKNPVLPVSTTSLEELENQVTAKNIQFKLAAQRLKPLCEEVERRASQREYATLLNDVVNAYFQLRKSILNELVQRHVNLIAKPAALATTPTTPTTTSLASPSSDLFRMVREGCLYFVNLCENEYDHCISLFSTPIAALRHLLEGFFSLLYDHLRPAIIRTQDLQLLCSLIDIMRYEIIEGCIEKRPTQLFAIKPIADRIIEDVRDRLIFLVDIYIRDDIGDFVPTLADLDYPAKLISALQHRSSSSASGTLSGGNGDEATNTLLPLPIPPSGTIETEDEDHLSFAEKSIKQAWYPTLERTLLLLAKLYVAIDTQTFDGIGQDAVMTCSQTLLAASKKIESLHGKYDGYLFLVKYLVALQENIVPFDIDFFVLERNLDFSHSRDLLRRLLAGEVSFSSVFALSSNNAIFTILQSAAPRLTYSEKDLSKNIEQILKQTLQAFIFASTQLFIGPLLSFLTQARSYVNTSTTTSSTSQSRLSSQSFAEPSKVVSIFSDTIQTLNANSLDVLSKISLYLGKHKTSISIVESLKHNVTDALDSFHALIQTEYQSQDMTSLPIFTAADAAKLLDDHFATSLAFPVRSQLPSVPQ